MGAFPLFLNLIVCSSICSNVKVTFPQNIFNKNALYFFHKKRQIIFYHKLCWCVYFFCIQKRLIKNAKFVIRMKQSCLRQTDCVNQNVKVVCGWYFVIYVSDMIHIYVLTVCLTAEENGRFYELIQRYITLFFLLYMNWKWKKKNSLM